MRNLIIISASALLIFAGCRKKEKVEECTTASTDGTCILHLHHMVGAAGFAFNSDFTDDFGNQYQFTRAEWYLRVPGFVEHDNVTETLSNNVYFKVDPSQMMYTWGDVPAGTLHNMRWGVGVDSTTNHSDPNTYPTGSALANQSPSMHWGWSTGYIFCVLEGLVDVDGSGTYDSGETFALHVGVDTNYRDGANLHVDTTVPENGSAEIHLDVDYAEFIDGIDLSVDNSSHTMDNMPLAVRVADNFSKVLKLN